MEFSEEDIHPDERATEALMEEPQNEPSYVSEADMTADVHIEDEPEATPEEECNCSTVPALAEPTTRGAGTMEDPEVSMSLSGDILTTVEQWSKNWANGWEQYSSMTEAVWVDRDPGPLCDCGFQNTYRWIDRYSALDDIAFRAPSWRSIERQSFSECEFSDEPEAWEDCDILVWAWDLVREWTQQYDGAGDLKLEGDSLSEYYRNGDYLEENRISGFMDRREHVPVPDADGNSGSIWTVYDFPDTERKEFRAKEYSGRQ